MSARRPRPARMSRTPVRIRVQFVGLAAEILRNLLANGLDGPSMQLVVEGLALAELRRRMRDEGHLP